jgi:hypothetical protein
VGVNIAGLLAGAVCLALALPACGDGETTTVTTGAEASEEPSVDEEDAAIEKLLVEFGASKGGEGCDYYSPDFIAEEYGSLAACRRSAAGSEPIAFTVTGVEVDGETGTATVVTPGGGRASVYPVLLAGEPSDPYDGWAIDGFFEKGPSIEPEDSPEPTPTTPDEAADAYASCLEAAGAEGVERSAIGPRVSFSAGVVSLVALFVDSPEEAQSEAQSAQRAGSEFDYNEASGSAVLSTEVTGKSDVVASDPPKADERLAIGCIGRSAA